MDKTENIEINSSLINSQVNSYTMVNELKENTYEDTEIFCSTKMHNLVKDFTTNHDDNPPSCTNLVKPHSFNNQQNVSIVNKFYKDYRIRNSKMFKQK